MKIPGNVFLVGPMGSGKSTSGRLLAKQLGLTFIDSDRVIEERTGASIPLIFEIEGEEGFREREAAVIEELTQQSGIVLATGGGVVLREDNRRALRSRGTVVYLQASIEQQLVRTAHDRNRPLLQTEDREQRLREIMAARDPLYREIADIVVNTNDHVPRRVVNQIIRKLRQQKIIEHNSN